MNPENQLNQQAQAPEVPAAPPPTSIQSTPQPPKRGIPKWVIVVLSVLAGLIALVILGVVALFYFVNSATSAPVAVSDKFVDAVQSNDSDSAYELTDSVFKENTSVTELTMLMNSISDDFQGEEKVTGKQIETENGSTHAAVVYNVKNGGETNYIRVVLRESDTGWKVVNFRSSDSPLETIIE